jgi:hypothetical protein
MGISDFLDTRQSFHLRLIDLRLRLPTLVSKISHVHTNTVCKHAVSYNPGSLIRCIYHFFPYDIRFLRPGRDDRLQSRLTRLILFTFVTARLLSLRAYITSIAARNILILFQLNGYWLSWIYTNWHSCASWRTQDGGDIQEPRMNKGGSGNHGFRGGSLVSFWPRRKKLSR